MSAAVCAPHVFFSFSFAARDHCSSFVFHFTLDFVPSFFILVSSAQCAIHFSRTHFIIFIWSFNTILTQRCVFRVRYIFTFLTRIENDSRWITCHNFVPMWMPSTEQYCVYWDLVLWNWKGSESERESEFPKEREISKITLSTYSSLLLENGIRKWRFSV